MANNSNSVQPSDEEGSHSRNVISNDQTTSRPLSTSAPSQQPPPRPVRRKPDGNRATPPVQNRFHQPHGAAATGPTPAVVSSSGHSYLHGHLGFPSYQQQPPGQPHVLSMESPLPPVVQRGLGDRSNDKRKNAALEIEALIKSLQEANNIGMIRSVITVLSNDFCTSMNSNYRKGGLIGLAATAIGLHQNARNFLNALLPPVLHCFDDPEARVRYYACESVYNIAKVSRQFILTHFNQIFEGLAKLFADVDVDVKNGANLLDKLVKDIVTETETFHVEQFLPLLQNYIRRTNPYIRQLLVGWITVLDTIPDISMIDYLPEFLDGLFNMLSDSNREIRQAADSALSDFLREVTVSAVVEFGPIISILVVQCRSKERLNRLTAETWLSELIHHPYSGGDALLPIQAEILGAVLWCISDEENEIRLVAERTNDDCMTMVRETSSDFELKPLLDTLTNELLHKDDVPTKLAALGWINMLMEKRKADMNDFTEDLLPVLLRTLSDPSDAVILLDLQVLSRISLAQQDELGYAEETEEIQFQMVLNAILNLFAKDRRLLETRGSLIIRKLCVLLNAKSVYIRMADTMASYEMKDDGEVADIETLQFVSTMVQTLNLILLTASELQDLRTTLATAFIESSGARSNVFKEVDDDDDDDGGHVFATLFHCWAHNPIATFSLCLLARTYDLSFCLIKRFSDMPDVSVGFLMQIDKLVHLLESPIFLQLRLQLLDVESPCHAPLLKSIYGLLMCLPQGNAFRLLNERLATVCNLRDNLGVQEASTGDGSPDNLPSIVSRTGLSMEKLLERFDNVDEQHHKAKNRSQGSVEREKDVEAGTGASGTHPAVVEDSAQLGHIKPPSIADAFGVSREDEERAQHPLTRVSSDAKDSPDRPNMQQPIS